MSKMKNPVISVVVQTRQTPLMILKRCIQCIREQTYPNIEILLLDSNEKDSPYKEAILAESDFFADMIHLEIPEKGEYVNGKNAALETYHGEYITFLSAQDIMPPQRIEEILHTFQEDYSRNVIYTDMNTLQNNILESSDSEIHSSEFKYLSQLVFHRDCFQMTGNFDQNLIAHCDDDLWFRIHTMKLAYHLSTEESAISICPDSYHDYTPLNAAIGYRQIGIKYEALLKKNRKNKKALYQKVAEQYKKAGVLYRYLQFAIKALFF